MKKNTNPKPQKLFAQKQNKRGGTIDYSKWEKYDADFECERLEDDFKDDSDLTDEFEDGSRDEAITHKEKVLFVVLFVYYEVFRY